MAHVRPIDADHRGVNDLMHDQTIAPRTTTRRSAGLASTVVCPSCSMQASTNDRRLLQPLEDGSTSRRCRNCQAVIDLSSPEPRITASLA